MCQNQKRINEGWLKQKITWECLNSGTLCVIKYHCSPVWASAQFRRRSTSLRTSSVVSVRGFPKESIWTPLSYFRSSPWLKQTKYSIEIEIAKQKKCVFMPYTLNIDCHLSPSLTSMWNSSTPGGDVGVQ